MQTRFPARNRCAGARNRARSPHGRRHLKAEALPELQPPLIHRLKRKALSHSSERPGPVGDHPDARLLDVTHVRQRVDHSPRPFFRYSRLRWRFSAPLQVQAAPQQPLPRDHMEPEGLKVVPRVGTHDLPGQRAQFPLPAPVPMTRRRFPSRTCTPWPCRRQAMSAPTLNATRAQDSGTRHTSTQPTPNAALVSRSRNTAGQSSSRLPSPGVCLKV